MGNYIGPDPSVQKDTQNRVTYVAADGQTTFSATYTPGYLDVYQNGVKLQNTDITANNGITVALNTPCIAGDVVECVSIKASSPYDFYTKSQADLRSDNFYGIALGNGDAMTITPTPTPSSLVDGMEFKVRVPGANTTTTPSLTIMGLGVSKTIYSSGGLAVPIGAFTTKQEITLRYNQVDDRLELSSSASTAFVQKSLGNFAGASQLNTSTVLTTAQSGSFFQLTVSGNTITLPAATYRPGATFSFVNTSNGAVTLAVQAGGGFIVGNASPVTTQVLQQGDSVTFAALDGTNWSAVAGSFVGVGGGQTWQNVTGSRAISTTYYNTTGKPISVSASFTTTGAATSLATVNGVVVPGSTYTTSGSDGCGIFFIVPGGGSYSIAGSGITSVYRWNELR